MVTRPPNTMMGFFRDPDGNLLAIMSEVPASTLQN